MRRATYYREMLEQWILISIHALREESDDGFRIALHCLGISIHALREESDYLSCPYYPTRIISIHALREESDTITAMRLTAVRNFNPRSP